MRIGLWSGVAAYCCCGLFPPYIKQLAHVPAIELVLHRSLWSLLFVLGRLAWLWQQGGGHFAGGEVATDLWLVAASPVMAVPLLLSAVAARAPRAGTVARHRKAASRATDRLPFTTMTIPRLLTVACGAALAVAGLAHSQPAGETASIPIMIGLGAENVRLPGDEYMGLVGGSLLFGVGDDWWLGPAVYGVATGERGGLFVGGVQVLRRWRVADGWQLQASMYAGGGGGASAPVGGGLMLRPEIGLLRELGPVTAGLTLSHVRFPTGEISSSQLGLLVSWNGEFRHLDLAGAAPTTLERTGLGFDRLAGTVTSYQLRGEPERRIGLVGVRAEHQDAAWRWGIEAAAAAKGDAAGYMEILASLGHNWWLGAPSNMSPRIGLRAAVGLGGGGAVPTGGGGSLAKLTAGLTWPLGRGISVGAEFGGLGALDGPLRARSAQLSLAMDLEPDRSAGSTAATAAAVRTEWSASIQHYARAERVDGSQQDLQTIGLKLNRFVGDSLYLSAQAHSAFAGGAGAYSVGLVGVGLATPTDGSAWQVGAEAVTIPRQSRGHSLCEPLEAAGSVHTAGASR